MSRSRAALDLLDLLIDAQNEKAMAAATGDRVTWFTAGARASRVQAELRDAIGGEVVFTRVPQEFPR